MKWFDWASALNIDLNPYPMSSSSLLEFVVQYCDNHYPSFAGKFRRHGQPLLKIASDAFAQNAGNKLLAISKNNKPSMSSDAAIQVAHEQMLTKMDELILDLGQGSTIY